MGKTAYALSTLVIGITLGMNVMHNITPLSLTLVLLALFILNSITAKELVNKNFQLGRATEENLGLHGQIAALLKQTQITESLLDYLQGQKEAARQMVEKWQQSQ